MRFRLAGFGFTVAVLFSLLSLTVAAQDVQPTQPKLVPKGFGPNADLPFAGADPDGTGLPWKEPPPEVVEAAKKAPTPHLGDGHID